MALSPLRVALVAVLALPVAPLVHCTGTTTTPPSSGNIGPLGGALASTDYAIEITVPPGALPDTEFFTINGPLSIDGGVPLAAPVYTISACPLDGGCPDSLHLLSPAVISYTWQAVGFGGSYYDFSDYRVAASPDDGGAGWNPLANQSVDSVAETIEATTTLLGTKSNYSVIIPPLSDTCASVTEPSQVEDAGCAPVAILPGKCTAYAGAVTKACDGGGTLAVTCCYPTGSPICFTQAEENCESPCSRIPGSVATSCVPGAGPPLNNAAGNSVVSTCCLTDPSASVSCDPPQTLSATCAEAGAPPAGTGVGSCNDFGDGKPSWVTYCSLKSPGGGDGGGDAGSDAGGEPDSGTGAEDAGPDTGAAIDAGTDAGPVDSGGAG